MRPALRLATVIALLSLPARPLHAQGSYGLKGGLAISTFGGRDASGVKSLTRFGGGVFLEGRLAPYFGLEGDALYVRKGARETVQGLTADFKVSYIEIPLLAKAIIPTASGVEPALFAGPYVVAAKLRCGIESSEWGLDCAPTVKSWEYGATMGGSLTFPMGDKVRGLVDVRYDLSLTTLVDDPSKPADLRNRTLMLFAGFSVPFGTDGSRTIRTH